MVPLSTATAKDVSKATRPRSRFSSKSDNGRIAIIGGSDGYHGAPVLAYGAVCNTLAALRVGIGYAYLYVPGSIIHAARALSPNTIIRKLGDKNIGSSSKKDAERCLKNVDAVVIGSGIGRSSNAIKRAAQTIDCAVSSGIKIVVDADAIYALEHTVQLNKNVLITPQDREFASLFGSVPDRRSLKERAHSASTLSKRLGCCVLLKGHNTVVADGSRIKVIKSRSSALATMGTGDVLSGIVGGYMAAGSDAFDAAVAGSYVHSRIGDILHDKIGNHILSSDVVDCIPRVLKRFDKED